MLWTLPAKSDQLACVTGRALCLQESIQHAISATNSPLRAHEIIVKPFRHRWESPPVQHHQVVKLKADRLLGGWDIRRKIVLPGSGPSLGVVDMHCLRPLVKMNNFAKRRTYRLRLQCEFCVHVQVLTITIITLTAVNCTWLISWNTNVLSKVGIQTLLTAVGRRMSDLPDWSHASWTEKSWWVSAICGHYTSISG